MTLKVICVNVIWLKNLTFHSVVITFSHTVFAFFEWGVCYLTKDLATFFSLFFAFWHFQIFTKFINPFIKPYIYIPSTSHPVQDPCQGRPQADYGLLRGRGLPTITSVAWDSWTLSCYLNFYFFGMFFNQNLFITYSPTPFLLSRAHARGDPKQTSFCLGAGVSLHMGILDSQLAV